MTDNRYVGEGWVRTAIPVAASWLLGAALIALGRWVERGGEAIDEASM